MPKLPNFPALRAFEAAARLGSFRKAADELHVSHTVVSRHVRSLESSTGVELVSATPQGITLTARGAAYAAKISAALQSVVQATEELAEPHNFPTLHVSCSPGFAVRWLAPRISEFMRETPGIEITIRPTDRAPAVESGESDIDIRYAEPRESEATALILTRPPVLAVASPAWISNCADKLTLQNLPYQSLLHEETHAHWQLWFSKAGIELAETPSGTRYWNAALALEAATMGHGVALAPDLLVRDALDSGQLVQVVRIAIKIFPYIFVTRRDREKDMIVVKFRKWIQQHLAEPMRPRPISANATS
ncbi:MAG: LysR substrate-binding domain-containing protein [Gammaproteobacteria bacterium]